MKTDNVNINKFLFTRTKPQKKLEVIKSLSDSQVLATSKETIIRIIKEVGSNHHKSRDKELRISSDWRAGNHWNSEFESIEYCKKKLYVNLYVQYGDCDTDTTCDEYYETFFARGSYEGTIEGIDRHFNTKYYYYTYDEDDKIECLRSILLEYVHSKYPNSL